MSHCWIIIRFFQFAKKANKESRFAKRPVFKRDYISSKCQHAKERSSSQVGNLVIAKIFSSQTSNYQFTPWKNLSPWPGDVNGRIEYFFFLNGMFLFIYGFRSIRNVEGWRQLKSISYFPPLAAAAASRPSLNVRDVTRTINPIVVRSRGGEAEKFYAVFSLRKMKTSTVD